MRRGSGLALRRFGAFALIFLLPDVTQLAGGQLAIIGQIVAVEQRLVEVAFGFIEQPAPEQDLA